MAIAQVKRITSKNFDPIAAVACAKGTWLENHYAVPTNNYALNTVAGSFAMILVYNQKTAGALPQSIYKILRNTRSGAYTLELVRGLDVRTATQKG